MADLGGDRAVQLIKDIRQLKQRVKDHARDPEGWVDRKRKVFGFIVEGLFCQRFPPYTYAELMEQILSHRWSPDVVLSDRLVGEQTDQIIDAEFTFSGLLHNLACDNRSLPKGSWENLYSIALEYRESI